MISVSFGIVAASFNWHAWKELKLLGAPGVEIDRADGSDAFPPLARPRDTGSPPAGCWGYDGAIRSEGTRSRE